MEVIFILLLFLGSAASKGWSSTPLILNQNALDKKVQFFQAETILSLPEKPIIPDGFELGTFDFDGGKNISMNFGWMNKVEGFFHFQNM